MAARFRRHGRVGNRWDVKKHCGLGSHTALIPKLVSLNELFWTRAHDDRLAERVESWVAIPQKISPQGHG